MIKTKNKKYLSVLMLVSLISFFPIEIVSAKTEAEIPWGWYIARSTGIVGFILLYLSIFFGLSIRTPLLNKIIKPIYSYNIHSWLSVQALIFATIHGGSLLFDKYFDFSLTDILIPFALSQKNQDAGINNGILAMGIISFYLMIILVATSYGKKYIGHSLWRAVHFLNISLYFITIIHALYLGTDLKTAGLARDIFIYANFFLIFVFVNNLVSKLMAAFSEKNSLNNSQ